MHLQTDEENAELLRAEVPGLAEVSLGLSKCLKEARILLDRLFNICSQYKIDIDLNTEEQGEISLKVALVTDPQQMIQYAKLVQLVFQLNYFSKSYSKAINSKKLPQIVEKEAIEVYNQIETFRQMIEREYVATI